MSSQSAALNPNAMAFTPSACGNKESNPSNVPLSSDTSHVTTLDYNVNNSVGCRITSQSSGAVLRSEGVRLDHLHSSPDKSYIIVLLSLHDSVKDGSIALLIRSLIDCVRIVNDLCGGVDSEANKQSIKDIDLVVQIIASLCEGKPMQSMFNEVTHIAKVSTGRLCDRLSNLRPVSDLHQRLFKNRKDL